MLSPEMSHHLLAVRAALQEVIIGQARATLTR